jgi:hypothetical protein
LGIHAESARSTYRRKHIDSEPSFTDAGRFISTAINRELVTFAFPTDLHCPYYDPYAFELSLKIIESYSPDLLVCGSDALDFYSVSTFNKNPDRKDTLQYEIDIWRELQLQLNDAAPSADKWFLIGNHEDRLRRYLWKNPELASLNVLKLSSVLDFDSLGILGETHEIVINNTLCIKHGNVTRKESAYAARAELGDERYSINTLSGHTHRGGTHYATTRRGVVRADECFCLCDLNPEYVHRPNWQQGLVIGFVLEDQINIEPIPFWGYGKDKFAFWRGEEVKLT